LTNISGSAITGPISLVLDDLSSNVTLYQPSGMTNYMLPAGSPYVDVNTTLGAGESVTV
jgi:hypothetical protein